MDNIDIERESWMMEGQTEETAVCLLTHTKRAEVQQRLHLYTDYLCHLLNGRIRQIELAQPKAADAYFFDQTPTGGTCELIVFGEPDRSLAKRLLVRYDKPRFVNQLTTSLLIAREPRHPIKKILLIVRAEESDEPALTWACRLVKNRDIQVTCLPIVPAQPGFYRYGATIQPQQTVLMARGTSTSKYLSHYTKQLGRAGISHRLIFPRGEPRVQIEQTLAADDHDLVIVAAEPYGRMQRFFLGELVTPLLHWLDRPLLIAKPLEAK